VCDIVMVIVCDVVIDMIRFLSFFFLSPPPLISLPPPPPSSYIHTHTIDI
jgi:hypothetical protein